MTDQPQQEGDLLDQIMGKDPAYQTEATSQPGPTGDAPAGPVPEGKKSPADDKKDKRSSVYIYLLVLFSAAFLMLLLAYFVQQRNNDDAMDNLRDTMNLSREDLMKQIDTLEKENEALRQEKDDLDERLTQEQANSEEWKQTSQQYWQDYLRILSWHDQSNLLNCLEQFVDAGDYLMAAAMIQSTDVLFNRHAPSFDNKYLLSTQEQKYLALREDVFNNGACLYTYRSYDGTPDEGQEPHTDEEEGGYVEQVEIAPDAFDGELLSTAQTLCSIFRDSAMDPSYAVITITQSFQPDSADLERLYSGAFQPSTVELFEQVKADLIGQGLLMEDEGGTLRAGEQNETD